MNYGPHGKSNYDRQLSQEEEGEIYQPELVYGGKNRKHKKTRKNKKRRTRKLKHGKRRQTKHKLTGKTKRH